MAALARHSSLQNTKVAAPTSLAQQRVLAAVASALPRGAKAAHIKHQAANGQGRGSTTGSKPRISECWVGGSQVGKSRPNDKVGGFAKNAGTLASIGAAPKRRPSQRKAATLATIRESEEWAAEWATSSCAVEMQSDAERSDSDQEIETKPTLSNTSSKQVQEQPMSTTNVLSALQRYGGGKESAASASLGTSWSLGSSPCRSSQPSSWGTSLSKSLPSTSAKAQNAETAEASSQAKGLGEEESSSQPSTKSTLTEVVGSMNGSSSAMSDQLSSSSSESSSGSSSPDVSLSPRERK